MKVCLPFLLLYLTAVYCPAQRTVDVDKMEGSALAFFQSVNGEAVSSTKFVRLVDGTPYFNQRWMKGSVIIGESEYRNILLRVNLLETSLEFLDIKGEAMVCTMPVKQVMLKDSLTAEEYLFHHSSFLPENVFKQTWLQLLNKGPAKLYKYSKKKIHEVVPYGSATTEQHIEDAYTYYVLFNNQWSRVKRISDIAEFLSSKKQLLLDFIKSHRLGRDERDLYQLVDYFNSL